MNTKFFWGLSLLSCSVLASDFDEQRLIINLEGDAYICPSDMNCYPSAEEPVLHNEDSEFFPQKETTGIRPMFFSNLLDVKIVLGVSPIDIYRGDLVTVQWTNVHATETAVCRVFLDGREVAFGGRLGELTFTANNSGTLVAKCSGIARNILTKKEYAFEREVTTDFIVKDNKPKPLIEISGPTGLHANQAGEFRWNISNATQCERYDSISSFRTPITPGSGRANLAWGGIAYQWVTLTISCSGTGGNTSASTDVYIIPEQAPIPSVPKIKSFNIYTTSVFKATATWHTELMTSCNISSNYAGSYNKMPVPINTPVGGYAGLNTGGTIQEIFTLECLGQNGQIYRATSRAN